MKVMISTPAWRTFLALTLLLLAELFYIDYRAGQIGAAADPLRLMMIIALATGLSLLVAALMIFDPDAQARTDPVTAPVHCELAEQALRSHRAALAAVVRSAQDGTPDPALVELANMLQELSSSIE